MVARVFAMGDRTNILVGFLAVALLSAVLSLMRGSGSEVTTAQGSLLPVLSLMSVKVSIADRISSPNLHCFIVSPEGHELHSYTTSGVLMHNLFLVFFMRLCARTQSHVKKTAQVCLL